MRITQSISLSNIQTFPFYREGPPLGGENLPKVIGLFPDRRRPLSWRRSGSSE
jgi:hypothetical protein